MADLNGRGDVVGGIVVMRFGENALATIERVKERLATVEKGLPPGVVLRPVYDRSDLILRSIDTLREKLIEESIVVALVCLVFLFHARSALVAIITLPLGILIAFMAMRVIGINADIMSLGGIAIAIGAMIDAAIVMIENMHKHLEREIGEKRRRLAAEGVVVEEKEGRFSTSLLSSERKVGNRGQGFEGGGSRLSSSAFSSSPCPSSRSSRWRPRRDASSSRWPGPRLWPWAEPVSSP